MALVARPLYLDRIEPFVDAPVVKVLTCLRRTGKVPPAGARGQAAAGAGGFPTSGSSRSTTTRSSGSVCHRLEFRLLSGELATYIAGRYVSIEVWPLSFRREYAPLEAIADNYPKYVVSLDPTAGDRSGGIHRLRIPDFLRLDAYQSGTVRRREVPATVAATW